MGLFIEILGYAGMIFVCFSFLMKEIAWLRIFNILGAVLSCTYGILTATYPTAVLNGILILINVAYLIKYFADKNKKDSKK